MSAGYVRRRRRRVRSYAGTPSRSGRLPCSSRSGRLAAPPPPCRRPRPGIPGARSVRIRKLRDSRLVTFWCGIEGRLVLERTGVPATLAREAGGKIGTTLATTPSLYVLHKCKCLLRYRNYVCGTLWEVGTHLVLALFSTVTATLQSPRRVNNGSPCGSAALYDTGHF